MSSASSYSSSQDSSSYSEISSSSSFGLVRFFSSPLSTLVVLYDRQWRHLPPSTWNGTQLYFKQSLHITITLVFLYIAGIFVSLNYLSNSFSTCAGSMIDFLQIGHPILLYIKYPSRHSRCIGW